MDAALVEGATAREEDSAEHAAAMLVADEADAMALASGMPSAEPSREAEAMAVAAKVAVAREVAAKEAAARAAAVPAVEARAVEAMQ